jgi:hypothetical protein
MSSKNVDTERVLLKDIYPKIVTDLQVHSDMLKSTEVFRQLDTVRLDEQILSGVPAKFSFAARTLPRLSHEERQTAPMPGMSYVEATLLSGTVRIFLDDFGKIGGFDVIGLPEMYLELEKYTTKSNVPQDQWPRFENNSNH